METTERDAQRASRLFETLGGTVTDGFPAIHSPVYHTGAGTAYLRAPGVVMLARPQTNVVGLAGFLEGFDPELGFPSYLEDPTPLPDSSQLCKTAGQLCYASFGPRRTKNENAAAYFERLTSAGHGSVLEHASFSFLLYGISRSVTHELVRHRAGAGFCLTGDTLVYSDHLCNGRRQGVKKRSMAQLYEMTKTPHGRSRLKLLRPRSLDEETGTFVQGRVRDIVCSGVKPVFKVELEDGKTVTCSKDHRFLTPQGWRPLYQITNGLEVSPGGFAVHGPLDSGILVNGVPAHRDRDWLMQHYIERNHSIPEVADLAGVSTVTLKKWLHKYGLRKATSIRRVEYAERFGRTSEEEDLVKPRPRAKGRLFVPRSVRVRSVTYAGEQMTYDLEMEGPNHNFVANGIVTHNSQISQRYVSGAVLRFVERPEYQEDEELHRLFEQRAERAAAEYKAMADLLLERQEGGASMLSADHKTDARKKVQQTARSLLPNETEAPMVFTGNVRALRHIVEMRADAHAESEIRNLAVRLFLCLVTADPILFGDYRLGELADGTVTVTTEHRKA